MLVLSRKPGETIVIGEGENQVNIVVRNVKGDRVRIGIDAPPEVKVLRSELLPVEPEEVGGAK